MTTGYTVAVLPGDGIGEEVMTQALRVLERIAELEKISVSLKHGLVGGAAFDAHGSHFPDETKKLCESSNAILFGSVGGPIQDAHLAKWKDCERNSILAIRKAFSFYGNLRPLRLYPGLAELSPLKTRLLDNGVDIVVVRELLGDLYFGEHRTESKNGARVAYDSASYTEEQIRRIAELAFKTARVRRRKVVSVDKANVLDTSKLWRDVVTETGKLFPDVDLEHMLVDNCAMQLVRAPGYFDVVLTSNLFGDILSDLISVFGGSLGLMPSASLNVQGFGLYEPAGGTAPDIAGKGIANPIAQILSVALMLRHSFNLEPAAAAVETAVLKAVADGARTRDLVTGGEKAVTTIEFTDAVLANL